MKGLYQAGHGTATEIARMYMTARAAPDWLRQRVAAATLVAHVPHTQPGMHLARAHRHVMACSCPHNSCFKVLLLESVAKQLQRDGQDPLACPADEQHRHACSTYSALVVLFRGAMCALCPDAVLLHDYQDVPGLPRSHFDETVIWPDARLPVKRFEIDGWCHFNHELWCRQRRDVDKDAVVRALGVDMKRLHVQDKGSFAAEIWSHVAQQHASLQYSPAYNQYNDLR